MLTQKTWGVQFASVPILLRKLLMMATAISAFAATIFRSMKLLGIASAMFTDVIVRGLNRSNP